MPRLSPGACRKRGAWEPGRAPLCFPGGPRRPHHSSWPGSPQLPPVPAAPALASGAAVIGTGSRSCCSAGRDPPTRGFSEVRLSRSPRLPLGAEPHPPARPKWSHPQERAVARSRTSSRGRPSWGIPGTGSCSATLHVWEKESDRWAPRVRSCRARFPTG